MHIGLIIEKLMFEKKVKKIDLYHHLDISKNTLNDYLIGKTSMTVESLEKIAKFLNVPVCYFFDEQLSNDSSINANNGSLAIGHNSSAKNISLSDCQKELEHLKQLIEEKDKQLKDKEEIIKGLNTIINTISRQSESGNLTQEKIQDIAKEIVIKALKENPVAAKYKFD
jgi:transcriptional regulator with XRE-family HTH domain